MLLKYIFWDAAKYTVTGGMKNKADFQLMNSCRIKLISKRV